MKAVGTKDESSSLWLSCSGQKIERALAIKVEDVRPWGVGSKFSAAYADVSGPELSPIFPMGHVVTVNLCISYLMFVLPREHAEALRW